MLHTMKWKVHRIAGVFPFHLLSYQKAQADCEASQPDNRYENERLLRLSSFRNVDTTFFLYDGHQNHFRLRSDVGGTESLWKN